LVLRAAGLDLGMAAERVDDVDTLVVRAVAGNQTDKMLGLVIPSGVGLGGQVAVLRHAITVEDYFRATSISHDFDPAWRAEGLRCGVALPISRGHELYGVLYGASREPHELGVRVVEAMLEVAR